MSGASACQQATLLECDTSPLGGIWADFVLTKATINDTRGGPIFRTTTAVYTIYCIIPVLSYHETDLFV